MYIVDADRSSRTGLERLLRSAGHNVLGFATSNEFITAVDPESPCCLVLDARILVLSGRELSMELKARDSYCPIIVVTAEDDPESNRIAREINAAGLFRKPVDGTALLDAIGWALWSSCTVKKSEQNEVRKDNKKKKLGG